MALAFLAIRSRLRVAGEERWSAAALPFVIMGSVLLAIFPGMEFAVLAGAGPRSRQRRRQSIRGRILSDSAISYCYVRRALRAARRGQVFMSGASPRSWQLSKRGPCRQANGVRGAHCEIDGREHRRNCRYAEEACRALPVPLGVCAVCEGRDSNPLPPLVTLAASSKLTVRFLFPRREEPFP